MPQTPLRPLMLMGCTSDAGKSWLCSLLCRFLNNQGVDVAPFKAQNMSNNAAVTEQGGEIGRAQYFQSLAARQVPQVEMNPVLLKPQSNMVAQVVTLGVADRELNAIDWHKRKPYLWPIVQQSLAKLQQRHQLLVIEGAGSPAEVNLRHSDIVNMEVALECNARVLLVVDIDRGGAYAHLLGTWHCLSEKEQQLVEGFVINKFRGEQSLLEPANQWIEQQTGVPVVAVIPWTPHQLPEEDNFFHSKPWQADMLNIALIRYPFASNLDEFDALFYEQGINLVPVSEAEDLRKYQAVILPGSKHVVASLAYLRSCGLAEKIVEAAQANVRVLGICGGLQILGKRIEDPEHREGGSAQGLGVLPLHTTYHEQKQCLQRQVAWQGASLKIYEIHQGSSEAEVPIDSYIEQGKGWQQANCQVSYFHDLFANASFRQQWLQQLGWQGECVDWQDRLDQELEAKCRELSTQLQTICQHLQLV